MKLTCTDIHVPIKIIPITCTLKIKNTFTYIEALSNNRNRIERERRIVIVNYSKKQDQTFKNETDLYTYINCMCNCVHTLVEL